MPSLRILVNKSIILNKDIAPFSVFRSLVDGAPEVVIAFDTDNSQEFGQALGQLLAKIKLNDISFLIDHRAVTSLESEGGNLQISPVALPNSTEVIVRASTAEGFDGAVQALTGAINQQANCSVVHYEPLTIVGLRGADVKHQSINEPLREYNLYLKAGGPPAPKKSLANFTAIKAAGDDEVSALIEQKQQEAYLCFDSKLHQELELPIECLNTLAGPVGIQLNKIRVQIGDAQLSIVRGSDSFKLVLSGNPEECQCCWYLIYGVVGKGRNNAADEPKDGEDQAMGGTDEVAEEAVGENGTARGRDPGTGNETNGISRDEEPTREPAATDSDMNVE